jgi:hypothetical protein
MEEVVIKSQEINYCTYGLPRDNFWMYEIVSLIKKGTYRVDLRGYSDDYRDYLSQIEVQDSSPEFATAEEAEAYAHKEWVIEL